jgi:uncharacterized protein with NAD-binding domain and iron-sulfur cluster
MYGFFVKGKLNNLQNTVDTCLNAPANNKMRFEVLSPYVLTTYTRVNKAYSAVEVDRNKGFISEIDIITWIMVGSMKEVGGKLKLDHVYWFPHHVFVDSAMALINGRELFGYPKFLCQYDIPTPDQAPDYFSCKVNAFQPFSPETKIDWHMLMEVKRNAGDHETKLENFLDLIIEAGKFLASVPDFLNMDIHGIEQALDMLLKPEIDQLFLKQFPDSAGEKAVYQAIVAAPAVINKVHSVSLLGGEYELNLHQVDSFPLADTLGFELGSQAAILPFHLHFDFEVTPGEELVDNSVVEPEKIAILGGGVSAITAAFHLSNQPGWQNNYDITLYQMGWRIGGKGASGRNADYGERIEEHGLHIWFGFYENAFNSIKQAYNELDRPAGSPLATWQEAFKPHSFIVLQELINKEWKSWPIDFPTNDLIPGGKDENLDLWDLFRTAYMWIKKFLHGLRQEKDLLKSHKLPEQDIEDDDDHDYWLEKIANFIKVEGRELIDDVKDTFDHLERFMAELPERLADHKHEDHRAIKFLLKRLRRWLNNEFSEVLDNNDNLRRLYISADLGITILIGMLEDDVFSKGFDVINEYDYQEWLTLHGANLKYTVNSAPVRGFYDLAFAYENGDFSKPNIEAGTIIRSMLRVALDYKGAVMWKMQAGMGDTMFTPYYEVLKARGVKFEFFNKVEEVVADADSIQQIHITQQVALKEGLTDYNPLVSVKDLDCWPDRPKYDLLNPVQAQLLQDNNTNLESFWSDWPEIYKTHFGHSLPKKTLTKGVDFDKVIYGISVASVPHLCPSLLIQDAKLQVMVDQVKTVATQAYQVWGHKSLAELGWTEIPESGEEPVLSGFVEPFDTWASMDQLLDKETWPAGQDPKNVSYFCSAFTVDNYPPASDSKFPVHCKQQVKENAISNLTNALYNLWPNVAQKGAFDWSTLVDPNEKQGVERFDSQFWRANIDPSERYVLSVKGSSQHRLGTNETAFSNFYITGDWIKTGLNVGCVEAATMAGMQTSRVICGYPKVITGEKDF